MINLITQNLITILQTDKHYHRNFRLVYYHLRFMLTAPLQSRSDMAHYFSSFFINLVSSTKLFLKFQLILQQRETIERNNKPRLACVIRLRIRVFYLWIKSPLLIRHHTSYHQL